MEVANDVGEVAYFASYRESLLGIKDKILKDEVLLKMVILLCQMINLVPKDWFLKRFHALIEKL